MWFHSACHSTCNEGQRVNKSLPEELAPDDALVGGPAALAGGGLEVVDEFAVDGAPAFGVVVVVVGAVDEFHDHAQFLLVGELLVVELSRPDHADLAPLVGEDADESEHAGLGDESEREGHLRGDVHEHPGDASQQEEHGRRDQVHACVARAVEASQVGEEHAWEDDCGDGQPGALLVVGGVEGGELEFYGEVVLVEEDVVVGLSGLDVDGDHDDQFEDDGDEEGEPGHAEAGELEHLDQPHAHADAQDVVEDDVAVAEVPPQRHPRPDRQAHPLHHLELEVVHHEHHPAQGLGAQQEEELVGADGGADDPEQEAEDVEADDDARRGQVGDQGPEGQHSQEGADQPVVDLDAASPQRPRVRVHRHHCDHPRHQQDLQDQSPLQRVLREALLAVDVVRQRELLPARRNAHLQDVEVVQVVDWRLAVVLDDHRAPRGRAGPVGEGGLENVVFGREGDCGREGVGDGDVGGRVCGEVGVALPVGVDARQ